MDNELSVLQLVLCYVLAGASFAAGYLGCEYKHALKEYKRKNQ